MKNISFNSIINYRKNHPLAYRLLFYILIFSSILTLAGTVMQLLLEYQQEINIIDERVNQIYESYANSLSNTVWHLNIEQLKIQLQGILHLPDIQYLEIKMDTGEKIAAGGTPQTEKIINREYNLFYQDKYKKVFFLGKLYIVASLEDVYSRLTHKILIILTTQAIKTFFVSIFILFIVYYLITRHLNTMARYTQQMDLQNLEYPLKLNRTYHKSIRERDELDRVVNATNEMRLSLLKGINDRKAAENALRIERDNLLNIFKNMEDGVNIINTSYGFEYINPALIKDFGQVEDRKCYQYFYNYDAPCRKCQHADVFKGQTKRMEWYSKKAGKTYDVIVTPLQNPNGKTTKLSILRDISQRKLVEEKIKHHNIILEEAIQKKTQEMEIMTETLLRQEKLATIGKVSGSIAHELRNPLGSIKQAVFFVKRKINPTEEKITSFLDLIERQVITAGRVITNLLETTRMKEIKKENIDLNVILHKVSQIDEIKPKIEIALDLNPNPFQMWADPFQLQQVFVNLFTNATQAVIDGGIVHIQVKARLYNGKYDVIIKDNGCGIKSNDIEKVFEPLFTTKAKGTGLGLSICKHIIESHGGQILIESQLNQGTQIEINLPARI